MLTPNHDYPRVSQVVSRSLDAAASAMVETRPLTRRALLGKMLGAGAVAVGAVAAGTLAVSGAPPAPATQYQTTTALNLRSGPGTSYAVITVLPAGAIVAHTGASANGFFEVGYGGTYGWAHADYLVPATSPTQPVIIGTAVTTVAVNFRSGPSTGHQVLRVLAKGTSVQISGTVQNGFRYVVHNGLAGWVSDAYLASNVPGDGPYDPNFATTTAALNLRAEPSTSAKVLLVMPSGARVRLLDGYANGFRKVNYNGTIGWAHTAYLN